MHLRRITAPVLALVLLAGCAEIRMDYTGEAFVGREVTITLRAVNGDPNDDLTISERDVLLKRCNDALVCQVTARSDVPATRTFVGAVYRGSNTTPEARTELVVRWADPPEYDVSLAASTRSPVVGGLAVLTATASQDVGPSDYRIVIQEDFERVASCASGTECRFRARHDEPGRHTYLATIERDDGAVEAASDPIDVTWRTTTTTSTTTTMVVGPGDPGGGHVPPP